jgi:hypothetical protein
LIRLLGSFENVMEALIHAPEYIGGEVFLSALFANTRRNVSQDEQVITATIVVVDVAFFHLPATEGAIRIGGHGFVSLVRRSVHFGGLGMYTVITLRVLSTCCFNGAGYRLNSRT